MRVTGRLPCDLCPLVPLVPLVLLGAVAACEEELLSFTRSPYASHDDASRARVIESHRDFFARGVRMRTVYMAETDELDWLVAFARELEAMGEEVRFIEHLPV